MAATPASVDVGDYSSIMNELGSAVTVTPEAASMDIAFPDRSMWNCDSTRCYDLPVMEDLRMKTFPLILLLLTVTSSASPQAQTSWDGFVTDTHCGTN